jgi:hypothetical protein
MISGALVVAVLAAGIACSTTPTETAAVTPEPEEEAPVPGIWPPPESPAIDQAAKVAELGSDPKNAKFCGDTLVFDDRRMVAAPQGYERVGYIVCDGEFELPFNIFAIAKAGDGYVNNYFEVVAFDGGHTRIKLDDSKSQGVVYEVDRNALYGNEVAYKMTTTYAGTRLLYNSKVYELSTDGWTVDGKLVHSFPAAP